MKKTIASLILCLVCALSVVVFTACGNTENKSGAIDETYLEVFEWEKTATGYRINGLKDETATDIVVPDYVNEISSDAFWNTNIKNVKLGKGITNIEGLFYNCTALENVIISDGVKSIPSSTFYKCTALKKIIVPDSIISMDDTSVNIGGSAWFKDCNQLQYNVYDNGLYLGNKNNPYVVLVKATTQDITSCVIHQDTKVVADKAFWGCMSLATITIPNNIVHVGNAFGTCIALEYNEYDNGLYLGNATNPYVVLVEAKAEDITSCIINENTKVIYSDAFMGCSLLENIVIPNRITSIGSGAFYYCSLLTDITIPNTVKIIGASAFMGCDALTTATTGKGVEIIGEYAFNCCGELASLTFNGTKTQWNSISKGNYWNNQVPATVVHCTDGDMEI